MLRKTKRPIAAGAQDTTCDKGKAISLVQVSGSDPKLSPGTNRCLCSACGRFFGGVNGFERHRNGFQCVDPIDLGLPLNSRGYWVRQPSRMASVHGRKPVRADFSADPITSTAATLS
jgi:hypothetical protein